MQHVSVNVGESQIAAAVAEGELVVIDAELVQDGGPVRRVGVLASSLASSFDSSKEHPFYQSLQFHLSAPQHEPPWGPIRRAALVTSKARQRIQEFLGS